MWKLKYLCLLPSGSDLLHRCNCKLHHSRIQSVSSWMWHGDMDFAQIDVARPFTRSPRYLSDTRSTVLLGSLRMRQLCFGSSLRFQFWDSLRLFKITSSQIVFWLFCDASNLDFLGVCSPMLAVLWQRLCGMSIRSFGCSGMEISKMNTLFASFGMLRYVSVCCCMPYASVRPCKLARSTHSTESIFSVFATKDCYSTYDASRESQALLLDILWHPHFASFC